MRTAGPNGNHEVSALFLAAFCTVQQVVYAFVLCQQCRSIHDHVGNCLIFQQHVIVGDQLFYFVRQRDVMQGFCTCLNVAGGQFAVVYQNGQGCHAEALAALAGVPVYTALVEIGEPFNIGHAVPDRFEYLLVEVVLRQVAGVVRERECVLVHAVCSGSLFQFAGFC